MKNKKTARNNKKRDSKYQTYKKQISILQCCLTESADKSDQLDKTNYQKMATPRGKSAVRPLGGLLSRRSLLTSYTLLIATLVGRWRVES